MPIQPRKLPSQETVRLYLDYDPATGVATKRKLPRECFKTDASHKSHLTRDAGKVVGCKSANGYLFAMVAGVTYPLHRLIWVLMNGDIPEGLYVDHKNGVRDDNRWENIKELVNWSQNQRNAGIRKDSLSGYKGVKRLKSGRYWARVTPPEGGQQISLGVYDTAEEAHVVVMKYNKDTFGKYARIGSTTRARR